MEDSSKMSNPISFDKEMLMPQEEKLEQKNKGRKLVIGVPRESFSHENRVALAPHAVELLVEHGHTVYVETNAGAAANFSDHEYSEMGGRIMTKAEEIFQADIIIKVAPLSISEIEHLRGQQIIISALQIATQNVEYIRALQRKKITAIAYEFLRDSLNERHPIIESMSEISGSTAILIAAEYLSNVNNGKGEMLGGITGISPTDVVVLGATTAGEFAARTAMGLGATVKVFDRSMARLRQLQVNLGSPVFTSVIQPRVVKKALKTADVVIGALTMDEKRPYIVDEESIMVMKPNSVIIDIGIDHGGCFESSRVMTHENPTYKKFNVIHYCVPNIPSRVARTASYALSNIFGPILLQIGEGSQIKNILKQDAGIRSGLYLFEGILVKEGIGQRFGISSRDLDLLMAAF